MKFYICDEGAHHKNRESMRRMMTVNGIDSTFESNLHKLNDSYDVVMCCNVFFPPDAFPKRCKVIYGPQLFVFPDNPQHPIHAHMYDSARFFYNSLASWVVNINRNKAPRLNIPFVTIPMGLDLDHITQVPSLESRTKIMIYFKARKQSHLTYAINFLKSKDIDPIIIKYGSYTDADFKHLLQTTRFVLWIGSHESQGFAFQETQASNVPIMVWDVTSMRDECTGCGRHPYGTPSGVADDLAATTANCWSDKCGLKFFKEEEMSETFARMNAHIDTFTPRAFIEERLSLVASFKHLLKTIGLKE